MTRGGNLTVAEAVQAEKQLAQELAPFEGRWVAVRDRAVVASDDDVDSLLNQLERKAIKADRVFRVLPDSNTTLLF